MDNNYFINFFNFQTFKMKMKKVVNLSLLFFLIASIFPSLVYARGWTTEVNTFRITTDGSQQTGPLIYRDLVVYTNYGGSDGIDIWGYNLRTKENFPIIEKTGQQFLTGFHRNLVVYEDVDDITLTSDVRLYNLRTGEDILIAGGGGSQGSGVTNGRFVVYIDGGACGKLYVYHLRRKTTTLLTETACHPVRIWRHTVVWNYAAPGGTNVYGYDLLRKKLFDVTTADGFQEAPNIFGNKVVWHHYTSGAYGTYQAIMMKDLRTENEKIIYETTSDSLGWPAIFGRYIVWSQSSEQHVGGVMGSDFRTGEIFEVQEQGPHQNSHTMPSIWRNTAVWMAWRTGNGDIYGANLSKTHVGE